LAPAGSPPRTVCGAGGCAASRQTFLRRWRDDEARSDSSAFHPIHPFWLSARRTFFSSGDLIEVTRDFTERWLDNDVTHR
jgi:hypothetical protein